MAETKDSHFESSHPVAYVSLRGQIVECNAEFSSLFGKVPQEMRDVELTSLAKFDNPSAILEAAYELDQLASSVHGETWRAPLKSSHVDEEFILIARKYRKKLNGADVIEVRASPAVDAAVTLKRRESIRKSSEAKRERERDEVPASTSLGPQRVLVVEDSPTSLKLMARMIQRLGHHVMTATNGVDALDLLQNENFDIVLMDINMPLMNGLEASHEFRKLEKRNRASGRPYQKIIAMSGDISNTLFTEVTNAGFDAFIPKPLTEERFHEVLRLPCEHHK